MEELGFMKTSSMKWGSLLNVLVVLCISSTVVASAPQYSITPVPMESVAALNDNGQVVGYSYDYDAWKSRAYVWQNGVTTEINTDSFGGDLNRVMGINNGGLAVGYSSGSGISPRTFIWGNGVTTDIGVNGAVSRTVNDLGYVAGYFNTTNYTHAFVWKNGQVTELGSLSGNVAMPYGINNAGQIVGWSGPGGQQTDHAFIWEDGIMTDLGTLGGTFSAAFAISNSGQVVGVSRINGLNHAFIWQNGTMTDLGTLGGQSSAASINDLGQIVGGSFVGEDMDIPHAFIFTDGQMRDINAMLPENSGWNYLASASDINNKGQIIGMGYLTDGTYSAFLMTPTPEPATLLLFGLGGMAIRKFKNRS
jgi:probable HAF family extracellular repeat protein